ncbi:MAG: ACT domain-containing protein [Planctomycetes bacterium]|nr:ACT domain-containing protein [Planctomycetota bacterium]
MSKVLTKQDIEALPAGQAQKVLPGTLITSAARECAEARGIALIEAEDAAPFPEAPCAAGPAAGASCAASFAGAPPPSLNRSTRVRGAAPPAPADWADKLREQRRAGDPTVWSGAAAGQAAPPLAPPAADARATAFGPRETHLDSCHMGPGPCEREHMVVVTAVGRNRPRVLAELATAIADAGGDIREISQRIIDDYFHTILTVDASGMKQSFQEAKARIEGLSREGDYKVQVQHEKVFKYMHRV